MPIPHCPQRWDVGLPSELEEMMAGAGVHINAWQDPGFSEVPFYPFSEEGLARSIWEADRAILAGAMEYVPAEAVEEVRRSATIHPWTIVDQGGGKWRLCHDYSVGTNRIVATAPFDMQSVWDVVPSVRPGSHFAKYDIRDGFWHCPVAPDSRKRLVVRHPGTGRLLWASRLPFGYLDSPRLFCGLTEALVGRLRQQVAGLDIQFYVFVDDILVVGGDEALTRRGMEVLEQEFAARGVQWAPHKRRGPCRCIEFLGLLLANTDEQRGITLTEKRLRGLEALIGEWMEREPEEGELAVDPTEIARVLGRLVFASQVVRGGRTQMQSMLSTFKGTRVDWRRGVVEIDGVRGQALRLRPAFWRDLRWWHEHLRYRAFSPFADVPSPADLVVAGTDASDWGTGQVIWRDGGREESRLRFLHAERRRPINWRELLGIWRSVRLLGSRLRGKRVLIESDNMAAVRSVQKGASKAEDMQELVRRILRCAEEHDFHLVVTHTPGEKLDRPDQTSRGDPVEEPRVRLSEDPWSQVVGLYGSFSGLIGAEREHEVARSSREGGGSRLWLHPTFNTVGTALRRVGERLEGGGGTTVSALALVPDDDGPQWNSMIRHGLVVGRLREGSTWLEENRLGRWHPCLSRRPMRFVLFPRAAGATPRRVSMSHRESLTPRSDFSGQSVAGAGYTLCADGQSVTLDPLPGSFVYSMPSQGQSFGVLYRVSERPRSARVPSRATIVAQEVCRSSAKHATALARRRGSGFVACDVSRSDQEWRPNPRELWTVDHLVEEVRGGRTFERYLFNASEAHAQIDRASAQGRAATAGWQLSSPESLASLSPSFYEEYVPLPSPLAVASVASSVAEVGGAETDGLEAIARDLDRLHLERHQSNRGPEGQLDPRDPRTRGGETEGDRSGSVRQPAPYGEMRCAGCGERFEVGEQTASCGDGLIHPCDACYDAAMGSLAQRVGAAAAAAAQPPSVYAVYSEELGGSGLYATHEEASRWCDSAHTHARMWVCSGPEEGARLIQARTAERAAAAAAATVDSAGPPSADDRADSGDDSAIDPLPDLALLNNADGRGSMVKRAFLGEKLSGHRVQCIQDCIDGKCGKPKDDGSATLCLGQCGRSLHMCSCADLGKGYEALGNFRCVDCRLRDVVTEDAAPSDEVRRVVTNTMILELSQGAETTAGSYAEFTRLEEAYAMGMGMVIGGGGLKLPRHSPEAFKNFITWMAIDHERARSLESVVRAAGAMMVKVGLTDVTKNGSVKAHLKEMLEEVSEEVEPATAATPAMMQLLTQPGGIIDLRFRDALIASREKLQFDCEAVGGCRISEVAGGGESHGLLANNSAILKDPESGEVVVELHLEHSKTKFARYLDIAGETEGSQIQVEKHLREYWRSAGFRLTETTQAGIQVVRPDWWVVRVSLLGMSHSAFERLSVFLSKSKRAGVAEMWRRTAPKARLRVVADGTGSQAKKYVNVIGGTRDSEVMNPLRAELRAAGFESQLVPGPLLLATTGGKKPKLTCMPLTISTAMGETKPLLQKAYEALNANGRQDRELDVESGRTPKWTTHSLRRLANTIARRDRDKFMAAVGGVTEKEIDLFFGWHEKILLKEMQLHYEAMNIRERMKKARITRGL